MPKATSTNIKNKQVTEDLISSPELSYEVPVENELKAHTNSENKISFCETDSKSGEGDCTVDANINIDFRSDLRKMLDAFGTDINEALQAKKQRLEQYGAGAMKANETKLKDMLQHQSEVRRRYHEEMVGNVNSVLEQWNVDLSHAKDQELKMIEIVQQQMKLIQQTRASQLQRLASLRQIHESYHKNFLQEEAKQNEQCGSVLQELRKELTELQKMMTASQKEALA